MAIPLNNEEQAYRELIAHKGHNIVCVTYAGGENVAIECEDCGLVLIDADRPENY